MVQTQKPQAEQPTNLHAGKTQKECMVTSQAVCIGFKKHILLWNNCFSLLLCPQNPARGGCSYTQLPSGLLQLSENIVHGGNFIFW